MTVSRSAAASPMTQLRKNGGHSIHVQAINSPAGSCPPANANQFWLLHVAQAAIKNNKRLSRGFGIEPFVVL
jgi:hypothetical protein